MGHVIAVTGTKREAMALRGVAGVVTVAGGDPAYLEREIARHLAGAEGIASFGMAGALAPDLRPGDWVIGDRVTGAIDAACDPLWADTLAPHLPAAQRGIFYCDGRLIVNVAEKQHLRETTGALAVDMESHVCAAVAARAGLPLAILRLISDSATQTLPPALAVAMRPDGGLALGAMLRSLAAEPGQIAGLAASLRVFLHTYRQLQQACAALPAKLGRDLTG